MLKLYIYLYHISVGLESTYVEFKGFLVLFLVTDRQAYSTSGQKATGGRERLAGKVCVCRSVGRLQRERERGRSKAEKCIIPFLWQALMQCSTLAEESTAIAETVYL